MAPTFKFLDPFGPEDAEIFVGRDREIRELKEQLARDRLVLVYGPSGTGKTSVIFCGLAKVISETDWFPVKVLRQDDVLASALQAIRAHARTPIAETASLTEAVRSLYLDVFRPVYLVFDQFEELFVLGQKPERDRFFAALKELLAGDQPLRVILSFREEYIAALSEYEAVIPTLLAQRVRIEPMTFERVTDVVEIPLPKLGVELEHGRQTAERIARLFDPRLPFQLPYLQVYLSELIGAKPDGHATQPRISDQMIEAAGTLDEVLARFFDRQNKEAEVALLARFPGAPPALFGTLLSALITADGTKQRRSLPELARALADAPPNWLDTALGFLCQRRLVRMIPGGRRADGADDPPSYELAHDSLAARIFDRLSAENRAIIDGKAMISNRMRDSKLVKGIYLNRSELALLRPHLSQMALNPEQAEFVKRSRRRTNRVLVATVAGAGAIGLAMLVMLAFAAFSLQQAEDAVKIADGELNALAGDVYAEMRGSNYGAAWAMVRRVTDVLGALDPVRNDWLGNTQAMNSGFWEAVMAGDQAVAGATDEAAARKAYMDAVGHYRRAQELAEAVLAGDPGSRTAKLNLSLALQLQAQAAMDLHSALPDGNRLPSIDDALLKLQESRRLLLDASIQDSDRVEQGGNVAEEAQKRFELERLVRDMEVSTAISVAYAWKALRARERNDAAEIRDNYAKGAAVLDAADSKYQQYVRTIPNNEGGDFTRWKINSAYGELLWRRIELREKLGDLAPDQDRFNASTVKYINQGIALFRGLLQSRPNDEWSSWLAELYARKASYENFVDDPLKKQDDFNPCHLARMSQRDAGDYVVDITPCADSDSFKTP